MDSTESSKKRGKKSTTANAKVGSHATGGWVNPKSRASIPKDVGKRIVSAGTNQSGRWLTGQDGRKVYVTKDGQELIGRIAYMNFKKSVKMRGVRTLSEFKNIKMIGKGGYGVVFMAEDFITGETVALKRMMESRSTAMEVDTLASIDHPCIIGFKGMVHDMSAEETSYVYAAMEFSKCDLHTMLNKMPALFDEDHARKLTWQILCGVRHLHRNGVLHCDLKPEIILITPHGDVKICDFGLAKRFRPQDEGRYTDRVGTQCYMAPEILLGATKYTGAVDIWGVGCILAQLLMGRSNQPLFCKRDGGRCYDIDQLGIIFDVIGTPDNCSWPSLKNLPGAWILDLGPPAAYSISLQARHQQMFPSISWSGVDLLARMLRYEPEWRITTDTALSHPWFMAPRPLDSTCGRCG